MNHKLKSMTNKAVPRKAPSQLVDENLARDLVHQKSCSQCLASVDEKKFEIVFRQREISWIIANQFYEWIIHRRVINHRIAKINREEEDLLLIRRKSIMNDARRREEKVSAPVHDDHRRFPLRNFTCDVEFPLHPDSRAHEDDRKLLYFLSSSAVLVLVLRLMPTHCENRKISLRLAEIDFSCKIFVGALSLAATTVGRLLKFSELESARQSLCVGFSCRIVRDSGIAAGSMGFRVLGCWVSMRIGFYRGGNGREWKATM